MVCWTRPSSGDGGRRKKAVTVVPSGGANGADATAEGVPPAATAAAAAAGTATGTHAHDGTPIKNGKPCCDACDGAHITSECPIFKGKKRDSHKDAQKGKGPQIGGDGGSFTLRSARVVRQPGDGSCLFHSMAYGLGGTSASSLRREIADWIAANPRLEIAETPVSDWVRWDSSWCVAQSPTTALHLHLYHPYHSTRSPPMSNALRVLYTRSPRLGGSRACSSVATYARRMRVSGWGGGIEMAACSLLKGVNIHGAYIHSRADILATRSHPVSAVSLCSLSLTLSCSSQLPRSEPTDEDAFCVRRSPCSVRVKADGQLLSTNLVL